METRFEKDFLGEVEIDNSRYYGVHTVRALENFASQGPLVPMELVYALVTVKKAAVLAISKCGFMESQKAGAIVWACDVVLSGKYDSEFPLPAIQGGAGTSLNMNVNEVLANLAIEHLGGKKGEYHIVHPNDDVNRFQSTNDVYPTAVKIACIQLILELAKELADLQTAFQEKEKEFSGILKVGRTEMQDAVPITLGQEFSAFAEAVARDRWRVIKSEERLRQVNIGGTAIGTGINAPKIYIFKVIEEIRALTGLGIARAENGVEATQNADGFAEVSGILKAAAVNVIKITNDLRLLSSGPYSGIAEIKLPPRQAGSSIMPGKVNPVIPEFAASMAMQVIAHDTAITYAASSGQLELNAFLPVISYNLIQSIRSLRDASRSLRTHCIQGVEANTAQCEKHLEQSFSMATLLAPYIGYDATSSVVKECRTSGKSLEDVVLEQGYFTVEELRKVFDPQKAVSPGIAGGNELKGKVRHL